MQRTLSLGVLILAFVTSSCSVRRVAVKKVADAIASSGTTCASDDDPQLVRDAVPFSLKLIESVLGEAPNHEGLLVAASRGFTQYAYAFIQGRRRRTGDVRLRSRYGTTCQGETVVFTGQGLWTARARGQASRIQKNGPERSISNRGQGGKALGCAAALLDRSVVGRGNFNFERRSRSCGGSAYRRS